MEANIKLVIYNYINDPVRIQIKNCMYAILCERKAAAYEDDTYLFFESILIKKQEEFINKFKGML